MVEDDSATTNVLQAKKGKKPKPEGYDNIDGTRALLARDVSVKEFVLGSAPVKHRPRPRPAPRIPPRGRDSGATPRQDPPIVLSPP